MPEEKIISDFEVLLLNRDYENADKIIDDAEKKHLEVCEQLKLIKEIHLALIKESLPEGFMTRRMEAARNFIYMKQLAEENISLGKYIAKARREAKMDQEEVAKEINVDLNDYRCLEADELKEAPSDMLTVIASLLKLPMKTMNILRNMKIDNSALVASYARRKKMDKR